VDRDCAYAQCYRRYLYARRPAAMRAADTDEQTRWLAAGEKRAGFTDPAGACMVFHCGGKAPGTIEFLLCASRNRCAG